MNHNGAWAQKRHRASMWLIAIILGVAFLTSPRDMASLTVGAIKGIVGLGYAIGEGAGEVRRWDQTTEQEQVEDLERRAELAERRADAEARLREALPDGGDSIEGAGTGAARGVACPTDTSPWDCCPALERTTANVAECLALLYPPDQAWDDAYHVRDVVADSGLIARPSWDQQGSGSDD